MKVLVTADIHLHSFKAFSSLSEGVNTRALDIIQVLTQIADYAVSSEITNIFILGDIFHKRGTVDVVLYNLLSNYFSKYPSITFWLLVGNHDQATINADYNSIDPIGANNIKVISKPEKHRIGDKVVLFMPYIHGHKTVQDLIKKNTADYLFGHFAVSGAKVINTDFVLKDGIKLTKSILNKYKLILVGHYHTPQNLDKEGRAMYVGSPIHHSYSDEGQEKTFIELDTDTSRIIRHKTRFPEFRRVRCNKQADINIDNLNSKDYYRIICTDFIPTPSILDALNKRFITYEIYLDKSELSAIDAQNDGYTIEKATLDYVKANVKEDKTVVYKKIRQVLNNAETK
jgi:DNA repair exonuclease SbcCD nuclease subunit